MVLDVYASSTMATDTVFKGTGLSLLPTTLEFPTFLDAGKSFQRLLSWSFSNCGLYPSISISLLYSFLLHGQSVAPSMLTTMFVSLSTGKIFFLLS